MRLAVHTNPLLHLEHRRKDTTVALVLIVVLAQHDDRDRLGLILLNLLGDGHSQRLHCATATDAGDRVTGLHAGVFARQTLQAHANLLLPALLRTRRGDVKLRQRLRHRNHLFGQHLTVAPGDEAVNEREGIDRPGGIFFRFRLIGAEHPVTRLVHLDDDRAGGLDVLGHSAQGGGKGRDCGQARLGERD